MLCNDLPAQFRKFFLARILVSFSSAGTFSYDLRPDIQTCFSEFLQCFFKIIPHFLHAFQIIRAEFIEHLCLLGDGIDRSAAFYHTYIIGCLASILRHLILIKCLDQGRKLCQCIPVSKIKVRMAPFRPDFYPVTDRTYCAGTDTIHISVKRNHLDQIFSITAVQSTGTFEISQSFLAGIGCKNQISVCLGMIFCHIFCHHHQDRYVSCIISDPRRKHFSVFFPDTHGFHIREYRIDMCHKKSGRHTFFIMIRIDHILRFINKDSFCSLHFQPFFDKGRPTFLMMTG